MTIPSSDRNSGLDGVKRQLSENLDKNKSVSHEGRNWSELLRGKSQRELFVNVFFSSGAARNLDEKDLKELKEIVGALDNKLSPETTGLKKIAYSVKNYFTNMFANRGRQLADIKMIVENRINDLDDKRSIEDITKLIVYLNNGSRLDRAKETLNKSDSGADIDKWVKSEKRETEALNNPRDAFAGLKGLLKSYMSENHRTQRNNSALFRVIMGAKSDYTRESVKEEMKSKHHPFFQQLLFLLKDMSIAGVDAKMLAKELAPAIYGEEGSEALKNSQIEFLAWMIENPRTERSMFPY